MELFNIFPKKDNAYKLGKFYVEFLSNNSTYSFNLKKKKSFI
jgi:hypothetical protein